jgi:hypothetical protein
VLKLSFVTVHQVVTLPEASHLLISLGGYTVHCLRTGIHNKVSVVFQPKQLVFYSMYNALD